MTRASFRRGKRIDCYLQLGLPILSAIVTGFLQRDEFDSPFGIILAGVGAMLALATVQLTSFFTWMFATPRGMTIFGRKLYGFFLTAIVVTLLVLRGQDASDDTMFMFGLVMLFLGSTLGLFYFFLSFREYRRSDWPLPEDEARDDGGFN